MNNTPASYDALFNSIPDHGAIIDDSGVIVDTNAAWKAFAVENGGCMADTGNGRNYLRICEAAQNEDNESHLIYQGLNEVIKQHMASFSLTYPCHSPTRQRWFKMKCWPMQTVERAHVMVFHEDVTEGVLAKGDGDNHLLTDRLTGVAHRQYFMHMLELEWRRCMRAGRPLSVVLLDIDCFTQYNNHYGYSAGNECLRDIGRLVSYFTRRPGDIAARYGGQTFALLFADTPEQPATTFANRICRALRNLERPHENSPVQPVVTASLGVATLRPKAGYTEHMVMQLAEQALYNAKKSGRNTVAVSNVSVL